MKIKHVIMGAAFSLAAFSAMAGTEEELKTKLEMLSGQGSIVSVRKVEGLGLYEVVMQGNQIVYSTEDGRFVIDGHVLDTQVKEDITQKRIEELSKIDFSTLPFERAIKVVRGKGTRVIATFEDPNCGYCRRLAQELQKADDLTTYVFLYPILGQDSIEKSKKIWCAPDRATAWVNWMTKREEPQNDGSCDTSGLRENIQLGQKLGVNGTPTIYFVNGTRAPGAMSLEELNRRIQEAGPAPEMGKADAKSRKSKNGDSSKKN